MLIDIGHDHTNKEDDDSAPKSQVQMCYIQDDKKEKEFYDTFIFANEEGFFDEVMDALDDDEQIRRPGGCCVVS